MATDVYSPAEVAEIETLSRLRQTGSQTVDLADGRLELAVPVASNGACFLEIGPAGE
jgi:hypothetical protein